jgi:hypothetical protein
MLSKQGADIDDMVTAERLAIFKVALISLLVGVLTAWLLSRVILGQFGDPSASGVWRVVKAIRDWITPDEPESRPQSGQK